MSTPIPTDCWPPLPDQPATKRPPIFAMSTLADCVVIVVGSVLPWAKADFLGTETTVSGLQGDGQLTLALAIAIALLAVFGTIQRNAMLAKVAVAGAVLAIGVSAYDLFNARSQFAGLQSDAASVDVGVGLYICVAGSIAALVSSVLNARFVASNPARVLG